MDEDPFMMAAAVEYLLDLSSLLTLQLIYTICFHWQKLS